ncbi:hypothetical protein HYC85_014518 [Camellia sinensis]|uniref:Methanethiol oxidase n=1 Tax=Camellia sinensis TaxID=4442 RepID=A0A7J7H8G9_CAMSI|nr:hypothetical protein HYC85_014518 [Camellia sinensis]
MATNMVVMEHGSIVEKEVKNNHGCCKGGPGYSSPLTAMSSPRESHVYVTCVYTGIGTEKPDYLATVDIDPNSQTYSKVIHRLPMPHIGDELHHSGWNAYSSCYGDASTSWRYLVLPSLVSGCIYAIDTQENPKATTLHKYVELTDIIRKTGLAYPHTAHCLASGDIMIRFLHDPSKDTGFVGCALTGNMVRFFKTPEASWSHEAPYPFRILMMLSSTSQIAISVKPLKVKNWILPEMPGLMTDFLISLDDRYLYMDPKNPGLIGQVWVGGLIQKGSSVLAEADDGTTYQVDVPEIKGKRLRGGPQMIQLNLDGKRLYVTNSLFGQWDHQFYPDVVKKGSHILQIDVNTEKGGLAINQNFFVDFGSEPDGPSIAHEMRYPGQCKEARKRSAAEVMGVSNRFINDGRFFLVAG